MARSIVLHSPLPPDAIAVRLRELLGDRAAVPKRGVTGQGSQDDMLLFYHRPNFANSFRTQLVATMEPADGGTRIEGKIGTPGSAKVFMGCWFSFLSLFLGIVIAGVVLSGVFDPGMAPLLLIPIAMIAFGVLLLKLGTWNAAKDEAAILEFLNEKVQALPE